MMSDWDKRDEAMGRLSVIDRALAITGCDGIAAMAAELIAARQTILDQILAERRAASQQDVKEIALSIQMSVNNAKDIGMQVLAEEIVELRNKINQRDIDEERVCPEGKCFVETIEELRQGYIDVIALLEKWRHENGDYPESKQHCADDLEAALGRVD